MATSTKHIFTIKHLLVACFLVFALSPCIVKNNWFSTINLEHDKPFNKTKTTQTSSCQYSLNQQHFNVSEVKQIKETNASHLYFKKHYREYLVQTYLVQAKEHLANSPPKYILYKRLKINLA